MTMNSSGEAHLSPPQSAPSGGRINGWLLLFPVLLILGSGWIWWHRAPAVEEDSVSAAEPAISHPAPDFTLATLDGGTFSLSEQAGTPIVLNFWATWCTPCRRELPALQAAAERWQGKVLVIGVDQAEDPETVQRYADELGLTFPIPLDASMAVADRYNVRGLPTTFFIDGDGVIQGIWIGEMNSVTLAENVVKIIR